MIWFYTKSNYASLVDRSRISVYGWSYGGYMTTHLIGYAGGDVFKSGVSGAPIADFRFYDAMYSER